jgi:inosine-uridine nucleoside N-ribohydrolase
VGPLTNIAIAVRLEPKIIDRVKEVVIMGGSAFAGGNASPVAEANIYNDPHAAAIVFNAGWPLTMVGLDVTMKSIMTKVYLDEICLAGNPATNLIRDIIPFYQRYHDEIYGMGGDLHTHDPSAIAYVLNPGFFRQVKIPMFVETSGKCSGQTVPDSRNQIGDFAEVNVCLDVDSDELLRLFKERLTWDRELS